jgi:RNA polymerase sigma factor (TIGR02999 family)
VPVPKVDRQEVTQLLSRWRDGDPAALDSLVPLVYSELRRMAARHLRHERPQHTLQATALVHEAFVKLVDQRDVRWQNRAHFYGIAAQAMRRILVDHARGRATEKRGGDLSRVPLDDDAAKSGLDDRTDILDLDDALTRLAAVDADQVRVVELRYFGGLTVEETAEVLGCSTGSVKREWTTAKAWLYRELTRLRP